LRLLSGRSAESDARPDWSSIGSRIDVERLLSAPAPSLLCDLPRIGTVSGFATEEECDWVIGRARPKLQPAMVWDTATQSGKVDPNRSNSALELRVVDMDVVTALLRARISAASGLPEPFFEVPQVMQYQPGQEFKPHFDFLDPNQPGQAADIAQRGQRIVTFLIFLNDDYEGGETEFPKLGIRHRGRKGDALLFANVGRDGLPEMRTLHAGCPPTRGEKWIVSQWIRDRMPAV